MIAELLLIATAGIYDPMDMSGNFMYPSGVKEMDKYPRYAPPASKLATLILPRNILSKDGKIIKSGHYLAGLSISRQEILIFESNKEIFSAQITETEILPKALKLSTAEFYTYDNGESFIILTQGKYKTKAKIELAQ